MGGLDRFEVGGYVTSKLPGDGKYLPAKGAVKVVVLIGATVLVCNVVYQHVLQKMKKKKIKLTEIDNIVIKYRFLPWFCYNIRKRGI